MAQRFLTALSVWLVLVGTICLAEEVWHASFTYTPLTGLEREPGVCRRDPSDIIFANGRFHLWYTKVVRQHTIAGTHGYPSGYQGSVWHATSLDGIAWQERDEAIPKGEKDAFDATATFTPNILAFDSKFYLYYTAVGPGFDNGPYEDRNRTSISVATANSPFGPWRKRGRPILESTRDASRFDSYRVDDACLVVRRGAIWLYYKGRQWHNTPGNTKMGVAVAEHPLAEYHRLRNGKPVQDSGHEVLVWPYQDTVMSLVSNAGPHGRTLQQAADGITFRVIGTLPDNFPRAPGLFRADMSQAPHDKGGAHWGISMATYRGDPHLVRFDMKLQRIADKPTSEPDR